jgi:hypothetical protein
METGEAMPERDRAPTATRLVLKELAARLQESLQDLYGFAATDSTVFQAVQALAAIEETLIEAVDVECAACAEIADKESRVYRRSPSTLERMGATAAERIGAAIRTRQRRR